MRYVEYEKLPPMVAEISWSRNVIIILHKMNIMKSVISHISIICILSCSMTGQKIVSDHWKVINAAGLLKSNESFRAILFLDQSKGFLFGTNASDEVILKKEFNNENAVIYATDDSGNS